MDLISTNVFRSPAQICSVLGPERFNRTRTPFACSSLFSSLSLVGLPRVIYCTRQKRPRGHFSVVIRLRASLSSDGDGAQDPNNPDNENFSLEESEVSSDLDLPKDLSEFSPTSLGSNAGNQLNQEQLREVLSTLSQSLAVLSSALSEVSSAVRVLSASLSTEKQQPDAFIPASNSTEAQYETAGAEESFANPPEPWDTSTMPTSPTRNVDEIVDGNSNTDMESSVPQNLVEQNRVAHKLAYKLQQSFIQARVEGLGKPFEVAVEEFVDTCMEAHQKGIGLKELQLQLILQDGSLRGAFALRNQRFSNDPIFDELSRVRSLWVRLVYSTLAQVEEMENPLQIEESTDETMSPEIDGTETFVKQVIKSCLEEGYDLARIKLEQNFAGEATSPTIKAMRQNHYLVLLVVDKVQKHKRDARSDQ